MPIVGLTPVEDYGGWWVKRDDLACGGFPGMPAGSKVRQYGKMAAAAPGVPMLVGCSADSAMQIYVAAAAKQAGVPGVVFTAKRKNRTAATTYALDMGATVHEVAPGYLTQCRKAARDEGKRLGKIVRWDVLGALEDAAKQVRNLPKGVARVVVPTGSGLTAAGVLAGLARAGRSVPVVAVAVSGMATEDGIQGYARKLFQGSLPSLELVRAAGSYGKWASARLPSGAYLDPYYAAKAVPFLRLGDCLWVPGVRPPEAIPADCWGAIQKETPVLLRG